MALGPIALLVACGGTVAGASGVGSPDSGGTASDAGTDSAASSPILGQLLVTTEGFQSKLLETFSADLQPLPTPTFVCPGATAIVGACCLFAPTPPPPGPLPVGGGMGTPNYGSSAGILTLLDNTGGATIGTFPFGSMGYTGLPANYYAGPWQPGDILSVNATGEQIGPLNVSAPALSPPVVDFPSSIAPTADLRITWQPDPNADTMMIQILDTGSVTIACSAPDSDAAVTVDASLFAAYKSGDSCQAAASRQTIRYAQTPTGRVALRSFGFASFRASVQ